MQDVSEIYGVKKILIMKDNIEQTYVLYIGLILL